jgi:hypothetical protein
MSKERKQRNKPEVPPEMAEAQEESGLPELPPNIPQYLAYKPSPDTGVSLVQLQAILQQTDAKLRASNHLQAHPMMIEMVLPALLQIGDWMMRAHRDLVVYSQNLASWSVDRHVVPAVPVKLAAALLEHLKKEHEFHELIGTLLPCFSDDSKKEAVLMADKISKELDEEIDDLGEEIDDETFDPDEDDDFDDDEDEDEEDEDEDEEDEDEPDPADLVEVLEGGKKRKDPDAEPLF